MTSRLESIRVTIWRRLRKLRGLIKASALGLADQAVISATNFITVIVLARALTPSDLGAFVLAYTGLLLLNGLQTALVTQPHNVLGQARSGPAYATYTSTSGVAQLGLALPLGGLALAAAAVAHAAGSATAAGILLALVPAIVTWQVQEFARRVLYTERRLGAALLADLLSYGGQAAVLVALAAAGRVAPAGAILVVAATSALGAAFGGWKIRSSLVRQFDRAALRENWEFGKWLGAAIAASWLAGHLYVYLSAIVLGPTATGALRATQVILGPLNSFFLFLFTVLPIQFARTLNRSGNEGLHAELRRAWLATSLPVVLYCVLAAVFASPALRLLYGDTYEPYAGLVVLFSAYYLVMHMVFLLTSALSARRQTRSLFRGSAYAGMVGAVVGWPLLATLGVEGAAVGMILGAFVVAVAYWQAYQTAPATTGSPDEMDAAPAPTQV